MDSYRGFAEEPVYAPAPDDEPVMDRPPEIGVDERRMHVRAYNYWVSLLGGRPFPIIQDVDPANIDDFGPHSVLLDFTRDAEDPEIAWLGRALRVECGLDAGITRISQVPGRSLLSRLTDHYLQIIANSAPIGFEAEFVGQRGNPTLYRGILMPLSSTGDQIDFIYGVINWKELADSATQSTIVAQVGETPGPRPAPSPAAPSIWADGPNASITVEAESEDPLRLVPGEDISLDLWPDADTLVDAQPGEGAALADRLSAARESAEAARGADHRSRSALYRAIGLAYDFAVAAETAPEDYAELLADAGIKVQKRAPMTPVAKLVFGADYDKTRLTEFAAVLSWAAREGIAAGTLAERIETQDGGIKAIVAAERKARRPAPKPDLWDQVRSELSATPALARVAMPMPAEAQDFVLLIARAGADGLDVVGTVTDEKLTKAAIRKRAA